MTLVGHIKQRILDIRDDLESENVYRGNEYSRGMTDGHQMAKINEIEFLEFLLRRIEDGQIV